MSENEIIRVELGDRSYPVHVGSGLLDDPASFAEFVGAGRPLVVTDGTVGPLYLERLCRALDARSPATLTLPAGEEHKTLSGVSRIIDELAARGCRRDATLVALGGGVVGDMAGFAAACYMRGIAFVQVPTTLLAQVDASVGGKTGVNHPAGKNLIGAFHQPRGVIADTATLATLPAREYRAGLAEVVKYGVMRDSEFFQWLEEHVDPLNDRQPETLTKTIARSVRNKAEVVGSDERERGQRALLNLGHTFGHALESATAYRRWLHGEAVAIGLVQAARLAERIGICAEGLAGRLDALLSRLGLDTAMPGDLEPAELLESMRLDKKAGAGGLRFVLPERLGAARVVEDVADRDVLAVLDGA